MYLFFVYVAFQQTNKTTDSFNFHINGVWALYNNPDSLNREYFQTMKMMAFQMLQTERFNRWGTNPKI